VTKKKPKSKHRRPGPKMKPGPKVKTIGAREIKLIIKGARAGATKEQIASALGMSAETFYQRQKENPEISKAFQEAQGVGILDLADKAFTMARRGNKDLLKFLLERKGGYTQTSRQVLANDPDSPLPAAINQTVLVLPANGREIKPDAKGGAKA
jgi:hypothetical protein